MNETKDLQFFDADFSEVRDLYPKTGGILADWEAWCEVESLRPESKALTKAIKAELSANQGRYLPSFANWLRRGDWDRIPTPDKPAQQTSGKPQVYRDEFGNYTHSPLRAVICQCGGKVITEKTERHPLERYCEECGRNYPMGDEHVRKTL
jgi:hypothetical protein